MSGGVFKAAPSGGSYPSIKELNLEPNEEWKLKLRKRIEEGLQLMVEAAKDHHTAELQRGPVSVEERERLLSEHHDAVESIRKLAVRDFQSELERERQQRRWASGQPMLSQWSQAFQGEQDIIARIKEAGSRAEVSTPSDIRPPAPVLKSSVGTQDPPNAKERDEREREQEEERDRTLFSSIKHEIWKPSTPPEGGVRIPIPFVSGRPNDARPTVSSDVRPTIFGTTLEQAGNAAERGQLQRSESEQDLGRITPELDSEEELRKLGGAIRLDLQENKWMTDMHIPRPSPKLAPKIWRPLITPEDDMRLSKLIPGRRDDTTVRSMNSVIRLSPAEEFLKQEKERQKEEFHKREKEIRERAQRREREKRQEEELKKRLELERSVSHPPILWKPPTMELETKRLDRQTQEREALAAMRPQTMVEGMVQTDNLTSEEKGDEIGEEVEEAQNYHWSWPIIEKLKRTFRSKPRYQQFLSLRGSHGQQLLDLLQLIINLPNLEDQFRNEALAAMQRLSRGSRLYPTCFDMKDAVRLDGEGPVAAGSFADIHKGYFQDQPVCLKSIRVYQKSKVNYIVKQVSREAILWSSLSHPNLLPFYGVYRDNLQRVCLVSPWVDNGHIKEYLENNPNADRAHLSLDVAAGIAYLHEMEIIHGDLKGPNILVSPSGRACLADFGLSGVIDHQILNWTSQSSPASTGGSVRWQAPELLAPEDIGMDSKIRNSKRSDVYAWSCVCYEIFTSRDPFFEEARNATVTLKIIRGDKPSCPPPASPPRRFWALTQPIWNLMSECWTYDPAKRPSIDDIIARLARTQEASPDTRPPQNWGYVPTWRFRDAVNGPHGYPSIEELDSILS